jgi:hypothetical protein
LGRQAGISRALRCTSGQALAAKRRAAAARGYDYFLEATHVEVYNEGVRDLLAAAGRNDAPQGLPVSRPGPRAAHRQCPCCCGCEPASSRMRRHQVALHGQGRRQQLRQLLAGAAAALPARSAQPGPAAAPQVIEHVDDGYSISGVTPRIAQAPEELRAAFNMGRASRDMQVGRGALRQGRAGGGAGGHRLRAAPVGQCRHRPAGVGASALALRHTPTSNNSCQVA